MQTPTPTRADMAAVCAADACDRASRRLYALPMACPLPLYRLAVRLAECADACADALRRAARQHYAAALLQHARALRASALALGPDTGGLCRAMARAVLHEARATVGRQRGMPYCGPYAYSETSGY